MGFIKHSVFCVTVGSKRVDDVFGHIRDLFSFDRCAPVVGAAVGPVVNGYVHIAIHSTGSKAGWGLSEEWDQCAKALAAWLREHDEKYGYPEWVWVSYGADCERATVVMCSDGSGIHDVPSTEVEG